MKKSKLLIIVIFMGLMMTSFVSCIKTPLYWITSSGILTYNKTTGQLEFVWDYKGHSDTIKIDSLPK